MFGCLFHVIVIVIAHDVISMPYAIGARPQHCSFIMTDDFQNCGNRADELATFQDLKKNRVYSESSLQNDKCVGGTLCRKLFKISRVRRQSFGSKTLVQISDMLHRCCGNCTKYMRYDITVPLSEVNMTFLRNSDIIYPVSARSALVNELHGFHFIPVYNIPTAFYFTRHRSDREKTIEMISGCLSMWPLLVICLLLALIAGFVCWILETRANKEEFSRCFHIGLIHGFWWSFVSMTTVGYGDKVPKSLPARMFSILWIVVGITMTSIYIAELASIIMEESNTKKPDLSGSHVGILKNTLHDSIMVAQHGGIVRTVDFNDTVIGMANMIRMVDKKQIDGFLVTRPTYYYFARMIKEHERYKNYYASLRYVSLHREELCFRHGNIATGMLIKDQEDYEYFKKYFESNWLQIQGCYLVNLNYKENKFQSSHHGEIIGLFYPFLATTCIIVGLIFLFGLVYEAKRRCNGKRSKEIRKDADLHSVVL